MNWISEKKMKKWMEYISIAEAVAIRSGTLIL